MREIPMTDEKKPFSFAAPFTAPNVDPDPEPVSKPAPTEKTIDDIDSIIKDIDAIRAGQTISIAGIVHDDIYLTLRAKYQNKISFGKLEISYSRTDERDNHEKWAEGGTLTVTRK
jgi:hypothetical protein